ncbi:hypothetical protein GH714_017057 [Hevea brasiliensis]|uniref:Reverse transcriptase Ty1/copia-type domain-containing protein n=1 Tax=Hevea brasiliensis TaxID=3981 RepID=A0A6A6L6M6_HEVBR|nr:hypothetical protein GH714_017057 [Hevea brasiliensis]
MNNSKPVTILFIAHVKLSADVSLKTNKEIKHMFSVYYFNAFGSIMYAMFAPDPTFHMQLVLAKMSDLVVGCMDSDFAGDSDNRRSLASYLFNLSGSAIIWKATLQAIVAFYTIEAEYMTLAKVVKEAL